MVTGAARADAALIIIDASEGVQEQTRRHGYLLRLIGVRQVVVVVNKMDLVDYSQTGVRHGLERVSRVSGEHRRRGADHSSPFRRGRATTSPRAERT